MEIMSLILLAPEVTDQEANNSFGLLVNLVQITDSFLLGTLVPMAGDNTETAKLFSYLGVNIHNTGTSQHDIKKCITTAWTCTAFLDRNV